MMNSIWNRIEITEMTNFGICIAKPKIYVPQSIVMEEINGIILLANSRDVFEEKLCDKLGKEGVHISCRIF